MNDANVWFDLKDLTVGDLKLPFEPDWQTRHVLNGVDPTIDCSNAGRFEIEPTIVFQFHLW